MVALLLGSPGPAPLALAAVGASVGVMRGLPFLLAIFSQFTLPLKSDSLSLFATGVVCIIVATVVDSVWLILGGIIRPIFKKPLQARILRFVFATLMIMAVGCALLKLDT